MRKYRFFYGWVVVGACFVCCATYGTFYTFGIFFKPLQESFGWSHTLTSSVQSLHILVYVISSFFIGWATDRYSPRFPLLAGAFCLGLGYILCSRIQSIAQLYMFYSIASVGAGIVWSLPLSTVQRWFIQKRGLALGITLSGIGVGTFFWTPLVTHFIYSAGWRTAYAMMGVVTCAVLFLAAFFISTPEQKNQAPYSPDRDPTGAEYPDSHGTSIDLRQALRSSQLWLICLLQFLFNFGLFLVFVHLVPYAIQMGIDPVAAAGAIALIGASSVLGKVVSPTLVEKSLQARWEKALALCAFGAAFLLFFLTQISALWMLYLFVTLYGYFYGSWIPMVVALTGRSFGIRSLGSILGVTQIGLVGGILGPLAGGLIYDLTGGYTLAFLVCGSSFLLAGFTTFAFRTLSPGSHPETPAS
jgi:OFA family oxalate/formate antiporter-like MFS transporter